MTMQIPQLTYNDVPEAAYPGQVADLTNTVTDTAAAEVALDSGVFVVTGAAGYGTCRLPTATGQISTAILKGVARYLSCKEPTGTANRFAISDAVPVLRRGRIWVKVADVAVTADQVPYIYHTGASAGQIRGTTDASATVAPTGVVVKKGAAAGGLALVEINLP